MLLIKTGKIYFWKYLSDKRNYSGYHVAADKEGISAMATALPELERGPHKKITIRLTPPTPVILSVPNNKNARVRSFVQLDIIADRIADDFCCFTELQNGLCQAVLSLDLIHVFLEGLAKMQVQEEWDFSCGNGQALRFWWTLTGGAARPRQMGK